MNTQIKIIIYGKLLYLHFCVYTFDIGILHGYLMKE